MTLRWGARIGVSRYRVQLAQDVNFADIVFDRVISSNQTEINDLAPGKYFWRIAPLTAKLGEFSSAGVVEVIASATKPGSAASPSPAKTTTGDSLKANGAWRVAIGDVSAPVLAHLRRIDRDDLVVTNNSGLSSALDVVTGVAIWTSRELSSNNATVKFTAAAPVLIHSPSGLDDVVILAGPSVVKLQGTSGRQLWRTELPALCSAAITLGEARDSKILITDTSGQRLFVLNATDGRILNQSKLLARMVGTPFSLERIASGTFALAYENGQVEIRKLTGDVVRGGSAESHITTAPVLVRGRFGDLILVGTRDGLTAMTADTLRPLGRVSLNNDMPRGSLAARDLDGDGVAEVLMTTVRRHIIAVNTGIGKILWEAPVRNDSGAFAFADLNHDGVIDVVSADGPTMVALSGRDGSVIWKDNETSMVIANHTAPLVERKPLALSTNVSTTIVVNEPGSGLRAITFANSSIRPPGK